MVFEFGSSVCAETVAGKVPVVGLGGLQLGNAHIRHNQRESLGRRRGPHGESDRAVHVPFDRFLGFLIGARTRATIIGSAPIKKTADGAEIGNQPVMIDIDEPIVVSNALPHYPLQYYDTPHRYFTLLSDYIRKPLKITDIQVTEYGKATNVVDATRQAGARVLGIRVKSAEEHDAVAAWLKEDPTHRAVLFHTAGYRDGYKLFAEFPAQTTFGDIQPAFE